MIFMRDSGVHNERVQRRTRALAELVLRTGWSRLGQMRFTDPKSDFIEKIETVLGGATHHEPFDAAASYIEENAVGGKEFPLDDF